MSVSLWCMGIRETAMQTLQDTVNLMLSEDPMKQLQGEYYQAVIRLKSYKKKLKDGTRDIPKSLLLRTIYALELYKADLYQRMCLEGIFND